LRDARVAQDLAEEMAREEERKRRLEAQDQRIARQIQVTCLDQLLIILFKEVGCNLTGLISN
jgi:hypothetical protein